MSSASPLTSVTVGDWVLAEAGVKQLPERMDNDLSDRWENLAYLTFGQSWPDNDQVSVLGWLTVRPRGVLGPLVLFVAYSLARGIYSGWEKLLRVTGLVTFL